jgi:hypothetical protein
VADAGPAGALHEIAGGAKDTDAGLSGRGRGRDTWCRLARRRSVQPGVLVIHGVEWINIVRHCRAPSPRSSQPAGALATAVQVQDAVRARRLLVGEKSSANWACISRQVGAE